MDLPIMNDHVNDTAGLYTVSPDTFMRTVTSRLATSWDKNIAQNKFRSAQMEKKFNHIDQQMNHLRVQVEASKKELDAKFLVKRKKNRSSIRNK